MWQDALALLMVVTAVLGLLHRFLHAGRGRVDASQNCDPSGGARPAARSCGGCALGGACATGLKVHPLVASGDQHMPPAAFDRLPTRG